MQEGDRREEHLGETLLDQMRRAQRKAWELLAKMESEGDHRGSIVALREVRECIGTLGEMLAKAELSKPVQEEPWDLSRLTKEQLEQFGALMALAYGVDSLENMARQRNAS